MHGANDELTTETTMPMPRLRSLEVVSRGSSSGKQPRLAEVLAESEGNV